MIVNFEIEFDIAVELLRGPSHNNYLQQPALYLCGTNQTTTIARGIAVILRTYEQEISNKRSVRLQGFAVKQINVNSSTKTCQSGLQDV